MDTRVKDGKLILGAEEFELPGYSILEAIGDGANAEVFLVYNEVLDRNEALKVWRPHKHQVSVSKEQFYAELRKNALFTGNDSIATVYTGGYQAGIYYCIMEYCPGITLKEFLKSDPSWLYRWGIARQISDTMKMLYERGVFHGDLHSNNIIIDTENEHNFLKILDLGTSFFSGREKSQKRDAQLLFDLSFQLLPCARELAFYNDHSISELPSPLLNQAFRAIVNISMPRFKEGVDALNSHSLGDYLSPDYHELSMWEIANMVHKTPLFLLSQVEKFLDDYGFNRLDFYFELHNMLNPDIPVDENNIIDITTKAYLKLFTEHREKVLTEVR